MTRVIGGAGILVVLLLVMLFARWNSAETVTLDLGFHSFHRVPVTYVAFGSLFLGMLVMLVAGIHADLRVRRFLRERLEEEDRQERSRIDLTQQDLFLHTRTDEEEGDGK
jgi:uncharacterized integral membrane protein